MKSIFQKMPKIDEENVPDESLIDTPFNIHSLKDDISLEEANILNY